MNEPLDKGEQLPTQQSQLLPRGLWVAIGLAVLLLAFLGRHESSGLLNLLIPAGAWLILRGLL